MALCPFILVISAIKTIKKILLMPNKSNSNKEWYVSSNSFIISSFQILMHPTIICCVRNLAGIYS